MDYKEILERIHNEIQSLFGEGKVADYIPALAKINPHKFGMAITIQLITIRKLLCQKKHRDTEMQP